MIRYRSGRPPATELRVQFRELANPASASSIAAVRAAAEQGEPPIATQAISNVIGGVGLNATPSLANGNGVVPTQGGTALSATNGGYQNMLVGNAGVATGAGATGSTSPRNTVAQGHNDDCRSKARCPCCQGGSTYNTVAASVTAQSLTGGGGGAVPSQGW